MECWVSEVLFDHGRRGFGVVDLWLRHEAVARWFLAMESSGVTTLMVARWDCFYSSSLNRLKSVELEDGFGISVMLPDGFGDWFILVNRRSLCRC